MAEGGNFQLSSAASSDEALQLDSRTDAVSEVNVSSDSGDYETLIRTDCTSSEHLNADVSEVTQEARKVLEQFLKLSLGQSCISSLEGHTWTDVEPQYAVLDNIHKDSQPTPYQPMGSDQSLFDNMESSAGESKFSSGAKAKTIYHELTCTRHHQDLIALGTGSPATALRQQSAPSKGCSVSDDDRTYMPLLIRKPEHSKKFLKENLRRKSSSSSMGDYEYSDTIVTNRKRKSLLRLAKERLQRSFRHEKKKSGSATGSISAKEEHSAIEKDIRKIAESSPSGKLRLSYPRGCQKACYSSSSPYEVGENVSGSLQPHGIVAQAADTDAYAPHYLSETGYLTGETDDTSKKDTLSPPTSKKLGAKPKAKKSRDIFGGIFKQLRKSSQKPQGKTKDGYNSSKSTASPTDMRASGTADPDSRLLPRKFPPSSADNSKTSTLIIGHLKDESKTQADPDNETTYSTSLLSPRTLQFRTGNPESSLHELRSKMQLEGLVPCLPVTTHPWRETKTAGIPKQEIGLHSWKAEGRNPDETDGGKHDLKALLFHHSSKPFSQKTDHEKDELYEHIAGQLATIAYNYTFGSPQSNSAKPTEANKPSTAGAAPSVEWAEASAEQEHASGLEAAAVLSYQPPGERSPYSMIDSTPVVAELVQSTSYRCFEQIITSSIGASETGWHQIAMMFRLTQSAIVMAGMGTAVALQIKELTLKYFEDRFANWIVTQGGWESMVDEANTELDSELD